MGIYDDLINKGTTRREITDREMRGKAERERKSTCREKQTERIKFQPSSVMNG